MIPVDFDAISDRQSAQIVQIESSKLMPLLIILAILCGGAIVAAWTARDTAFDAQTQALLLRAHVEELRQEMAKAGLPVPPLPDRLKTPR